MRSKALARTDKIYPLTSVRFFAAFYVVVQHTLGTFVPHLSDSGVRYNFPWRLIFAPSSAVSFFFLLSGYVLSVVYLREGQSVDRRSFFAARFARIYPLFLVTLALDTPHLLAVRLAKYGWTAALGKTALTFAAHLVMLHAWYPRLLGIDGPNWSISDEAFFYLCFPVLGALLWKLRGAGLWVAALGLYVGGLTAVWGVRPHLPTEVVMFLPLLHLPTFALGVLLARLQRTNAVQIRAWQANTVFAVAVAFLVMMLQSSFLVPWDYLFFNGLFAPMFAAVIWALSSTPTMVSRVLSTSWMVALGDSSFALYLIHLPMFHLFEDFHLVNRAAYPIYLVLCVGMSLLSFYYFETPARAWLLKRMHSRSLETVEEASSAQ